MCLSKEQEEFISIASEGKNILLTAPAGYGKSFVLESLKNQQSGVYMTSTTGRSAMLINGITIHSFLGIGIGFGDYKSWLNFACKNRPKFNFLRTIKTIIIDECSMLSAEFLDNMNKYLSIVRKNSALFGGIQIILVGDIFQLEPVEGKSIIKSELFDLNLFKLITFTIPFRQDEEVFLNILNKIRIGNYDSSIINWIKSKSISNENLEKLNINEDIVYLLSTNKEVNYFNDKFKKELIEKTKESEISYEIITSKSNAEKINSFANKAGVCSNLKLVKGCKIMITYNLPNGLRNGSVGIATELHKNSIVAVVNEESYVIDYIDFKENYIGNDGNVKERKLFKYLPIKLAYSITIHKSQGSTIESPVVINLNNVFSMFQIYVAISRVKKENQIYFLNTNQTSLESLLKRADNEYIDIKLFYSRIVVDKYIRYIAN